MIVLLLLETKKGAWPLRPRLPVLEVHLIAKWADRKALAPALTRSSVAPYEQDQEFIAGGKIMRLTLQLLLAMALLPAAMTQVRAQAAATGPIHVATYVEVGTGAVKDGIALLKQYRDATAKEAGNTRIGVGQEIGRANRFVMLEIWKDQAAFDAHGKSASTAAFRDKLKAIQNEPYDERVHSGMSVADSPASANGAVYVVSHVDVPPPKKDEVIAALNPLADQSRKGTGNLRFDVWQQT